MTMPSMNAYSKDLRLKTLAAIDRAIPRVEVCELFGISLSTIKRWLQRRRQTGGVETMKIPGRPSVKGRALREWLPGQLEANPDLTLKEHCEAFEDETAAEVSEATMSRNIARLPGQRGRSKKVEGSPRTRRGAAGALAVAGLSLRREAIGVRGREPHAHLDGSSTLSASKRRASLRQGTQEPREEHDADRLHYPPWDGRSHVHPGRHRRESLRDLRRAFPGSD